MIQSGYLPCLSVAVTNSVISRSPPLATLFRQKFGAQVPPRGIADSMKLNSALFEAFLKCPTKCYLHLTGHTGSGNAYAEWLREQNEGYRNEAATRLIEAMPEDERAATSPSLANIKTATWR